MPTRGANSCAYEGAGGQPALPPTGSRANAALSCSATGSRHTPARHMNELDRHPAQQHVASNSSNPGVTEAAHSQQQHNNKCVGAGKHAPAAGRISTSSGHMPACPACFLCTPAEWLSKGGTAADKSRNGNTTGVAPQKNTHGSLRACICLQHPAQGCRCRSLWTQDLITRRKQGVHAGGPHN